jgi:hypothetical protein
MLRLRLHADESAKCRVGHRRQAASWHLVTRRTRGVQRGKLRQGGSTGLGQGGSEAVQTTCWGKHPMPNGPRGAAPCSPLMAHACAGRRRPCRRALGPPEQRGAAPWCALRQMGAAAADRGSGRHEQATAPERVLQVALSLSSRPQYSP